jgi:hypothetical protein
MRFIERMEDAGAPPERSTWMMPQQPPELLDLFFTDHRERQAVAAAERLRGPSSLRAHAAALLRGLADRLAPPSRPSVDGKLAGRC